MGKDLMFKRDVIGIKDDDGRLLREGDIVDTVASCDFFNHEVRGIIQYNSDGAFFEIDFPQNGITKAVATFTDAGAYMKFVGTDEKLLYDEEKEEEVA